MKKQYRYFVAISLVLTTSGCAQLLVPSKSYEETMREAQEEARAEAKANIKSTMKQFGGDPPDFQSRKLAKWRANFMADKKRVLANPGAFFDAPSSSNCSVPQSVVNKMRQEHQKQKSVQDDAGVDIEFLDVKTVVLEGKCSGGSLQGKARWRVTYRTRKHTRSVATYSGFLWTHIYEGTFQNGRLISSDKHYRRMYMAAFNVKDPSSPKLSTPDDDNTSYLFEYSARNPRRLGDERSLSFTVSDSMGAETISTYYAEKRRGQGSMEINWMGPKKKSKYYTNAEGRKHGPVIEYSHASGSPQPARITCFANGQRLETTGCAANVDDSDEPATISPNSNPPHFVGKQLNNKQLNNWRNAFLGDRSRLWAKPDAYFSATPKTRCQPPAELQAEFRKEMNQEKADNPNSTFTGARALLLEGKCPGGKLQGRARWMKTFTENGSNPDMGNFAMTTQMISEGAFQQGRHTATHHHSSRVIVELSSGTKVTSYNLMYGVSKPQAPSKLARAVTFEFGDPDSSDPMKTQYIEPLAGGGNKMTQWEGKKKKLEVHTDAQGQPHGRVTAFAYDGDVPAPQRKRVVCFEHGKQLETNNCAAP